MEVLSEAVVYKMADRRCHGDVDREGMEQGLMASLLEAQNSHAERMMRSLANHVRSCIIPDNVVMWKKSKY